MTHYPSLRIFAIALTLCGFSILQAQAPLRLVSDPWPPFTGNVGEPRVVINLVEEALRRGQIDANTYIVETELYNESLTNGKFHGSPAIWKTKNREEVLLYSNPILENKLVLLGRIGSNTAAGSLGELTGKRVGIVDGYGYYQEIAHTGPTFVTGKDNQRNLTKLLDGEIDYMLVNEILIHYAMRHQRDEFEKNLQYGNKVMLNKPLYFAIRKDTPNAEKIIATFNHQLKAMIKDGSYQEILQLPWLRIDTDGDGKLELVYQGNQAGTEIPIRQYQPFTNVDDSSTEEEERIYRIKGQLYDSWDEIPNALKEPEDTAPEGILYNFQF